MLSLRRDYSRLRPWRFLACGGLLLVLFTAFSAYSRGGTGSVSFYTISLTSPTTASSGSGSGPGSDPPSRTAISKEEYIAAVLRDPVEGLLGPAPIRQKCDETVFRDGLVWHCAAVVGGIGNVANMLLNCIRYAIEAGATTLILPRLGARDAGLVGLGSETQSVELSYLFDVPYLLAAWREACPQIRAVLSDAEVPGLPPLADAPHLAPSHVKQFEMRKYLIVDPTGWREAFDAWLAEHAPLTNSSTDSTDSSDSSGVGEENPVPVRVWQDLVLAQWNRETHTRAFANAFPRLLRYPLQTRRLAASVLWNLEQKRGRPVVADAILFPPPVPPPEEEDGTTAPSSSSSSSLGTHRLASQGFMGAHLRVAADAAAAGWPGYEAQAPYYLAEAKRRNLTTIYLATGSAEHRERFREDAAREGLNVFTKEDLLPLDDEEGEELIEELGTLTWDQQALVDFDVLMRSAFFYGFVRSSFSWSIALRRGALPEAGVLGSTVVGPTSEDEYRDGLSAVAGRHENINPEGMWP